MCRKVSSGSWDEAGDDPCLDAVLTVMPRPVAPENTQVNLGPLTPASHLLFLFVNSMDEIPVLLMQKSSAACLQAVIAPHIINSPLFQKHLQPW